MNILLLGSGGREHAIACKLTESPLISNLYIAPGNAGTQALGTNLSFDISDFKLLRNAVLNNNIDMLIVGPEAPLAAGVADYFKADERLENIPVIGPGKEAARLESSKAYAKEFMQKYGVPTAAYRHFSKKQKEEALAYLDTIDGPYVLKADGLAAGKGVLIIGEKEAAKKSLAEMLNGKFGQASETVVVEEFLTGRELSVFVLTDGKDYVLLPEAKDYKRAGEGDTGLNTGGMGAVSPVPFANNGFMTKVESKIIKPTIEGLQKEGLDYKGFIFFGLMDVNGEPHVIEYNVRMGDPESQVVLPRIRNDLQKLFNATANGELHSQKIETDPRTAMTLVMASGGYPGDYRKGLPISGINDIKEGQVFHAGTQLKSGKVLTAGGRVLALTALGDNLQQARDKALAMAEKIQFDGKYFRKDIGHDLMSG